jgi:hypothetical protein
MTLPAWVAICSGLSFRRGSEPASGSRASPVRVDENQASASAVSYNRRNSAISRTP